MEHQLARFWVLTTLQTAPHVHGSQAAATRHGSPNRRASRSITSGHATSEQLCPISLCCSHSVQLNDQRPSTTAATEPFTMHVVVVGAGIAGLTAAIALRRSGHTVTIYEKSHFNNELGAAINVPPNVGRFLLRWGLDPTAARFVVSQGMTILSHSTLKPTVRYDHTATARTFGAPLYYAHRVDLHEALKRLATAPGTVGTPANVILASEVVGYVRLDP